MCRTAFFHSFHPMYAVLTVCCVDCMLCSHRECINHACTHQPHIYSPIAHTHQPHTVLSLCTQLVYSACVLSLCTLPHTTSVLCTLYSTIHLIHTPHIYSCILMYTPHISSYILMYTIQAWMVSLFTPWGQLCSTMPRLNIQTALEAVTNNTLAFRQQFDLPSCSQAPKNDATCTAFRCPVDFGTYNIKLSNYLVYLVLWVWCCEIWCCEGYHLLIDAALTPHTAHPRPLHTSAHCTHLPTAPNPPPPTTTRYCTSSMCFVRSIT